MIFYTFFCPCLWIEFLVRLCWPRGQAKPGYLGSGPRVPGGRGGPGGIWGCPRGSEGFCAGISYFQLIFSFSAAALRSGGAAPCRQLLPAGEQAVREGSKGKNRDGRKGRSAGIFPPLPQTCSDFTAVALPQDPLGGKKKGLRLFSAPAPCPRPQQPRGFSHPPPAPTVRTGAVRRLHGSCGRAELPRSLSPAGSDGGPRPLSPSPPFPSGFSLLLSLPLPAQRRTCPCIQDRAQS